MANIYVCSQPWKCSNVEDKCPWNLFRICGHFCKIVTTFANGLPNRADILFYCQKLCFAFAFAISHNIRLQSNLSTFSRKYFPLFLMLHQFILISLFTTGTISNVALTKILFNSKKNIHWSKKSLFGSKKFPWFKGKSFLQNVRILN